MRWRNDAKFYYERVRCYALSCVNNLLLSAFKSLTEYCITILHKTPDLSYDYCRFVELQKILTMS